jgi:NADH:ubiquinone oxidoreductase subunit H
MNSFIFFKNLNLFIPILISISLFTLAERKLMSSFQRRKGPNIVGIFGILQPISDGIKLIFKENLLPQSSNSFFFLISPISTLFLSFLL